MSIEHAPWDHPSYEAPEDFFADVPCHWPHYVTITLDYSLTWSASYTYDLTAGDATVSVTDTSTGTLSGTITWSRQSTPDETSEQDLAAEEFRMRMIFEGNASVSPRIDSALYHRATPATGATITGSKTEVTHFESEGEVDSSTETTPLTANPRPLDLGILESGTATWAKKLGNITGLIDTGAPIPLPTLITSFITSIGGPPAGAAITFSDSQSISTPDTGSWHGSSSSSYTLTLSA